MSIEIVPWMAAAFSLLLFGGLLLFTNRSFQHWTAALGFLLLGMEQTLIGFSIRSVDLEDVFNAWRFSVCFTAALPAVWLLFSFALGRGDRKSVTTRVRWIFTLLLALPLGLAILAGEGLSQGYPVYSPVDGWGIRLGWSGYWLYATLILGATLVVATLERALRSSTGVQRWQIKFLALGLGGLFAVRVYTNARFLLYSQTSTKLHIVESIAVIAGTALLFVAIRRGQLLRVDLYPSPSFLYRSITLLAVGSYLLLMGIVIELVKRFQPAALIPLDALVGFLGLLALAVVLLSDRLRQASSRLISRHLKRPVHDYRHVWTTLTDRTASLLDVGSLGRAVAGFLAETFQILSVSLWHLDQSTQKLRLAASTAWSASQVKTLDPNEEGRRLLLDLARRERRLLDLSESRSELAKQFRQTAMASGAADHLRYCLPLVSRHQLVGVLTLGMQVGKSALDAEDRDLLKVIADQAAVDLLNIQLAEKLQRAKQMEAFQTMSTFFVHDLKNLASRLALTLRNYPIHYDNPEFREDAQRTISRTLQKVESLTRRLGLLRAPVKLELRQVDLNRLVEKTLSEMGGDLGLRVESELQPLPMISADPDEIQKVLINLLLNAREAAQKSIRVVVATQRHNNEALLSVADNGPGMTLDFMEHRLFRPFQTTKPDGVGIGLFQSKMIVEAHQGRIEVESEEGKGSIFRVVLPVGELAQES